MKRASPSSTPIMVFTTHSPSSFKGEGEVFYRRGLRLSKTHLFISLHQWRGGRKRKRGLKPLFKIFA